MDKQRILFIGAGRMAEAIFSGLLKEKAEFIETIILSNQSDVTRLEKMQAAYNVAITTDWKTVISDVDIIVLACPPKAHAAVLDDMSPYIKGQFIVTVAAGIGLAILEDKLPTGTPVAWVMPNTSADVGESMSIYCYGQAVSDYERRLLEMMLDGIGAYEECTEQQIHSLTAITGSAPAFFYKFCEALEEEAITYGISREKARTLVAQMVYGSAAMVKAGNDPVNLREQVTSPGGATAAGLEVLEQKGYANIIQEAVKATNARALAQGKN